MKQTLTSTLIVLLLGLISCNRILLEEGANTLPYLGEQEGVIYSPAGTYFVQVSDAMAEQPKDSILACLSDEIKVLEFERLISDNPTFRERHRRAGLHKFYRIRCDESQTKSALSHLDEVFEQVSVPPGIRPSQISFNDARAKNLWHLFDEQYGININPVWERGIYGNHDMVIAVIDGGIDAQHEDLRGIVLPAGENGSKNFVDNNYNMVYNDHGTHVGGLVAAINNNQVGVCSPAGGNDGTGGIKLLNCQIFQPNEKGEDVVGNYHDAFIWAADHGAVICNNSWSFVLNSNATGKYAQMDAITQAVIDYFVDCAGCDGYGEQAENSLMKGGLVLFAAGNEALQYGIPASYERVLAVGSSTKKGKRAYYSNYGTWVDICAPGGDSSGSILSTIPCNTTVPNGRYGYMGGTSMACPIVTSVAALVLQKYGGKDFTREQLFEKLVKGSIVRNPIDEEQFIGPLLDAYGALCYGDSLAPQVISDFQIKCELNNAKISWEAADDADMGAAHQYIISWSEDKALLENRKIPFTPKSSVEDLVIDNGSYKVGERIDCTLTFPEINKRYYVAISSVDYNGNQAAYSPIKQVVTTPLPPDIGTVNIYPNPVVDLLKISYGEEKEFSLTLYNASGAKLYQGVQLGSAGSPAIIDMTSYPPGVYQLIVCYGDTTLKHTILK